MTSYLQKNGRNSDLAVNGQPDEKMMSDTIGVFTSTGVTGYKGIRVTFLHLTRPDKTLCSAHYITSSHENMWKKNVQHEETRKGSFLLVSQDI